MRVIFCYCKEPESRSADAVRKYAPGAEWIDNSGSIWDYGQVVASRWDGTDDLVVIEGDKEITAGVLPSFAGCHELWCSYSYFVYPAAIEVEVANGLGCTRYSARLQRIVSTNEFMTADDPYWEPCPHCGGQGCWRYLDTRIAKAIRYHLTPEGDIEVHRHGRINHHHDYSGSVIEVAGSPVAGELLDDRLQTAYAQYSQNRPRSAEEMRAIDLEFAGPYWER